MNYEKKRLLFINAVMERLIEVDTNACHYTLFEHDGYCTDKVVFVADWNIKELEWVESIISSYESFYQVCTAFDDEIIICQNCGKACYAIPGYYGDPLSFIWACEDCLLCRDCFIEEDNLDYFVDNASIALPEWAKPMLTDNNFSLLQCDYESGFHNGQDDDPKEILIKAQNAFPKKEFIFIIDGSGQFDINFSIYMRENK